MLICFVSGNKIISGMTTRFGRREESEFPEVIAPVLLAARPCICTHSARRADRQTDAPCLHAPRSAAHTQASPPGLLGALGTCSVPLYSFKHFFFLQSTFFCFLGIVGFLLRGLIPHETTASRASAHPTWQPALPTLAAAAALVGQKHPPDSSRFFRWVLDMRHSLSFLLKLISTYGSIVRNTPECSRARGAWKPLSDTPDECLLSHVILLLLKRSCRLNPPLSQRLTNHRTQRWQN